MLRLGKISLAIKGEYVPKDFSEEGRLKLINKVYLSKLIVIKQ